MIANEPQRHEPFADPDVAAVFAAVDDAVRVELLALRLTYHRTPRAARPA